MTKKQYEIIDDRLVIYKGFVCPCIKCKQNCIAKNPIEISDFDCGMYVNWIENGDKIWQLRESARRQDTLVYLRMSNH